MLVVILCLCNKIRTGTKLIEASSQFISSNPSILVVPFIQILKLFLFWTWWTFTFALLFSIGDIRYDPGDLFGDLVWSDQNTVFIVFFSFALFWGTAFIISGTQMVVAFKTIDWYFNHLNLSRSYIGISRAYAWTYCRHIGSIAFGSFWISLLWAVQALLQFIYAKLKEVGKDSYWLKCAMSCVACIERVISFVNRHIYVEVALRNVNFFGAASEFIRLGLNNFLDVAVISALSTLFLFFGSALISGVITVIGYFILEAYGKSVNERFDTLGPLIVIFLIAFVICTIINTVFEISIDAILHCYVLEKSVSERRMQQVQHVPDSFKEVINENEQYIPLRDPY